MNVRTYVEVRNYDIEKFVITNLHVFMALKIQCVHNWWCSFNCSVVDPDPEPPDPRVFGPPGSGSGSISQRYGSESGSF